MIYVVDFICGSIYDSIFSLITPLVISAVTDRYNTEVAKIMNTLNPHGNFQIMFFNGDNTYPENSTFHDFYYNDFENEIFQQEINPNDLDLNRLKKNYEAHYDMKYTKDNIHHSRYVFADKTFDLLYTRVMKFEEIRSFILERQLLKFTHVYVGYEVNIDYSKPWLAQTPSKEFWHSSMIAVNPNETLEYIRDPLFEIFKLDFFRRINGVSVLDYIE